MNKNVINTKAVYRLFTVLFLAVSLSLFVTSCTDDTPTTPDEKTTDGSTEFLIINGTRYEADDIVSKKFVTSNRDISLRIKLGGAYPLIDINHEGTSTNELVEREYTPWSTTGSYFPDGDSYEVGMYYAEGPLPTYCQYRAMKEPAIPHGKYELKKVDNKWVSEFGPAQMECHEGNTGDASLTMEGYLIWEEK